MHAKTGGKKGKHSSINESSNIAALSYICLELFKLNVGRQFHAVTEATSAFQTKQFITIPSYRFLSLLDTNLKVRNPEALFVELAASNMARLPS